MHIFVCMCVCVICMCVCVCVCAQPIPDEVTLNYESTSQKNHFSTRIVMGFTISTMFYAVKIAKIPCAEFQHFEKVLEIRSRLSTYLSAIGFVYVYSYVCIHIYMNIYIYTYTCIFVNVYEVNTYIYIYMYTYVHIYVYV